MKEKVFNFGMIENNWNAIAIELEVDTKIKFKFKNLKSKSEIVSFEYIERINTKTTVQYHFIIKNSKLELYSDKDHKIFEMDVIKNNSGDIQIK